jgi:hypothetical protein
VRAGVHYRVVELEAVSWSDRPPLGFVATDRAAPYILGHVQSSTLQAVPGRWMGLREPS